MQNHNSPIRILITGAHSFVGTNYRNLSENKLIDEVSLIDKKPEDIDFSRYDVILHLVAIVHQSSGIPEKEYFRVNRDLCFRVAELAKKAGVRQFIFMSTVKVYGRFIPGSAPWNEKSPCSPDDAYGKSKYEAEILLKRLESPDFIVSIIRTPLVYGEGVKANMYGIMKLVDMCKYLPFKGIYNKRSFTSIENLTLFIDRIIQKQISGTFIAMDETALSTTDLVKIISKFLGKETVLFTVPNWFVKAGTFFIPRIFDRLYGSFEMENNQTLTALDLKPIFSSEYCIEKMVRHFQNGQK